MNDQQDIVSELRTWAGEHIHFSVNGSEEKVWASISEDMRWVDFRGNDGDGRGKETPPIKSASGEHVVLSSANIFRQVTLVCGAVRTRGIFSNELSAHLNLILQGTHGDLEKKEISRVSVRTPFIGRQVPRLNFGLPEGEKPWRDFLAGKIKPGVSIEDGDKLQYTDDNGREWINGPAYSIGGKDPGGFKFDCMETIVPIEGLRGGDGLCALRDMVQNFRILLTLLNGGWTVPILGVSVKFNGACDGRSYYYPLHFLPKEPHMLFFGLTDQYYKNRLSRPKWTALKSMGMKGVKAWMDWCGVFQNAHLLKVWTGAMERTDVPLRVLEGLGRRIYQQQGGNGKISFKRAAKKVLDSDMAVLPGALKDDDLDALNEANNYLVKHIGGVDEDAHGKHRRALEIGATLADFIVGYGILSNALGNALPDVVKDVWAKEIKAAAERLRDQNLGGSPSINSSC